MGAIRKNKTIEDFIWVDCKSELKNSYFKKFKEHIDLIYDNNSLIDCLVYFWQTDIKDFDAHIEFCPMCNNFLDITFRFLEVTNEY